ncbi:uncharacterized protein BKA78DRAFT_299707 [Phyllosticta capitalensis]|uniref:uncharacterized protein n=1 Tax=Phyllosticta capitalensis TaxID=121624 RepID=UPI0031304EBA
MEKDEMKKFLDELNNSIQDGTPTSDSVAAMVADEERKATGRRSRKALARLGLPVVRILHGYYNVIDTMIQADPTPGAVIWGCLKILINSAHRVANLLESFRYSIQDIEFQMARIKIFENLFADSETMKRLLQASCINILKLCCLIWRDCRRHTFSLLLRGLNPSSNQEYEEVTSAIREDTFRLEYAGGWRDKQRAEPYRKQASYHNTRDWLGVQTGRDQIAFAQIPVDAWGWIFQTPEFKDWTAERTSHPILWLTANLGAGKSVLCYQVVQRMRDSSPDTAVAQYFYRFNEPATALETLQTIARQLLDQFWTMTKDIPDCVRAIADTPPNSEERVFDMIEAILDSGTSVTYIFIDGVDEDIAEGRSHSHSSLQILAKLVRLTLEQPSSKLRLWVSSQFRDVIMETMKPHLHIRLMEQNGVALQSFFDRQRPRLDHLGLAQDELEALVRRLADRAKGNFLWASLMINDLSDCMSPRDARQLIERSQQWSLDDHYRNLASRTPLRHRRLTSEILSVVCFARRRVSIDELRDALCMMHSPGSKELDAKPSSWILKRLFPPFVVTEGIGDDDSESCELFHATVKNFLEAHPDVLAEGTSFNESLITQHQLAEVCIRYLLDSRLEGPVEYSQGQWKLSSGTPIEPDGFLRYSAKYWNEHVDAVEPTPRLGELVTRLLFSPNYQTLLQLQHLFVDRHFSDFTRRGWLDHVLSLDGINDPPPAPFVRKVFPDWFAPKDAKVHGFPVRLNYHDFIDEWSHYLKCGCCENPDCLRWQFAGEVDRCFFGALGPNNFMSRLRSRYVSFQLSSMDPMAIQNTRRSYLGHSSPCEIAHVVQFVALTANHMPRFVCETWNLKSMEMPTLRKRQFLEVGEQSHWELYFKLVDGDLEPKFVQASPVAFSGDGNALRIGSSIFVRDLEDFVCLQTGPDEKDCLPAYFEDFMAGQGIVVVASRGISIPADCQDDIITGDTLEHLGFPDEEYFGPEGSWNPAETWEPYFASNNDDMKEGTEHAADSEKFAFPESQRPKSTTAFIQVYSNTGSDIQSLFSLEHLPDMALFESPPVFHPQSSLIAWPLGPSSIAFLDYREQRHMLLKIRVSEGSWRIFTKCQFSVDGHYLHVATLEASRAWFDRQSAAGAAPLGLKLFVSTYRLGTGEASEDFAVEHIHRSALELGEWGSLSIASLPFTLTWTPEYLYVARSAKVVLVHRVPLLPQTGACTEQQQGSGSPGSSSMSSMPTFSDDGAEFMQTRDIVFLPSSASRRSVRFFPGSTSAAAKVLIGSVLRKSARVAGSVSQHNRDEEQIHDESNPIHLEPKHGRLHVSLPIGVHLQEDDDLGGWIPPWSARYKDWARDVGRLGRRRGGLVEVFDRDDDCDLVIPLSEFRR